MTEKLTILIADDDPTARELMEEHLEAEGMRVVAVAQGSETLGKARAVRPDLILLDIMMPDIDGFEVCRRLREDPLVAEVPVIMITALNDRASRLKGLEAGADDFLTKPYDGAELDARVRTISRLNRYRRLLAERAKFEWVVEHTEDGYVLLADDDRIAYANPSARLYLGRMAEIKGPISEPFLELVRFQYRREPEESWESWPAPAPTPRYLVRPETPSARSFWLRVEVLELPAQHEARYLVRLRDDTSQVILKRDKWKFNALVGHKLRTPLTMVLGGLDMLAAELHEAPSEELADLVEMSSKGALRLKDQVLEILDSLDVPDIIQAPDDGFELKDFEPLAKKLAAQVELDAVNIHVGDVDLDERLVLSPVAFDLVLRELLTNARKFHPKETPTLDVRLVEDPTHPRRAVKLSVGDDGMHVPPELLERVWAPYFQSEKGFSGSIDGMGLGLSIVASLVWAVDGGCRIYNQEDGPGIVVELVIPLAG